MREPVFQGVNVAGSLVIEAGNRELLTRNRDKALLWRATNLAIESAFRFGRDLPVGAVAAEGDWIVGRYFASDQRNRIGTMHAEMMAIADSRFDVAGGRPDTVVVTVEPCDNCQDFLARQPSVRRVGFGLSREDLAMSGLVKAHPETIFARALRLGLPYEVVQIDDPDLLRAGGIILDHVERDLNTGAVKVNQLALSEALAALNEES